MKLNNYRDIQREIRSRIEDELMIDLNKRRESGKHDREKQYVYARAVYYRLLWEFTTMSTTDMGRTLDQHHATVLHSNKNVFPHLAEWGEHKYVELYLTIKKELEPIKEKIRKEAKERMDYSTLLRDNQKLSMELANALKEVNNESSYIKKFTAAKYQLGRLKWLVNENRYQEAKNYIKEIETINL